jgi:pSer/pThr/pTyr-binding forkhead associated (FHA) protein
MNQAPQVREQTIQLPDTAPRARVTAGVGSAGQKTWNLRRPVTLIGAKRPAHILLHDPTISNAHCVLVNTGTELLLKDLHTSDGTQLNGTKVDLAVLKDGDVIRIGNTNIQIAIQPGEGRPDDSGCGLQYADPTRFAIPVQLQLMYTEMRWAINAAVTLIGRHQDAAVRLDHEDLCSRHAVLFRFQDAPAIFDISDKTGLLVNDQAASLTPLCNGDHLRLGPFALEIGYSAVENREATATAKTLAAESVPSTTPKLDEFLQNPFIVPPIDSALSPPANGNASAAAAAVAADPLTQRLCQTWDELNRWPSGEQPAGLRQKIEDLKAKEAELDARDAVLRGKLHDVTLYHEQVVAREREIAALAARTQSKADAMSEAVKQFKDREQELTAREAELQRREAAVSQRWSRLQSFRCPHCNKPVNISTTDEA